MRLLHSLAPEATSRWIGWSALLVALAYLCISVIAQHGLSLSHFILGMDQTLPALAMGLAPVVALVVFAAISGDRLSRQERRALVLGAGTACALLLPLLRLVS